MSGGKAHDPASLQSRCEATNLMSLQLLSRRGHEMARSPLAFQPDAERFYAQGYWRSGDLWEDVAARAQEHPERVAMVLGERRVSYDELRRAAVGVSHR